MAFYRCGGIPSNVLNLSTVSSASSSIATFTTDIADGLVYCLANITAEQAGNGTPSPTNVRTISGYSNANITRCSKNLFNGSNYIEAYLGSSGVIISGSDVYIVFARCKPNTSYTVSKTAGTRFVCGWSNVKPEISGHFFDYTADSTASSITLTTGNTAKYILSYVYNGSTDVITKDAMLSSVQIEEAAAPSTFESYNGTTTTISLGSTIYGGTLDVLSGKLTVTDKYINLDGSEGWLQAANGAFYLSPVFSDGVATDEKISNIYDYGGVVTSSSGVTTNLTFYSQITVGYYRIWVKNTDCADTTAFKAALNSQNLQVVYKLATPSVIQLSSEQIEAAVNLNNIFSDTGDISVKYLETVGHAIS